MHVVDMEAITKLMMQELDLSVLTLLDDLAARLGTLFSRSETPDRALRYLQGLLSQCERKNSWHLAEWLGDATPDGVQYLLDRARCPLGCKGGT